MSDPVVTIKQGKLRGVTAEDFDGHTYYKFLGLPYAKPPLGNLRFKAPQPAEAWTGVREATIEGNICFAHDPMTNRLGGSEDCLYLNVYTRQLPGAGVTPKPVMVNFHGGGFIMGSGTEETFGTPDYLMTGDIVFVNLNYRLGVFGFLSSDDQSLEIPGNAGLKDQREALKWVQQNISQFNGDPNNVTIFGISAGGASVHYQMLSESTKGLFHKAISQSGTALGTWAWGSKNAVELAKKLGKEVDSEQEALNVLMAVDTKALHDASNQIEDGLFALNKRRPFSPVVEKPNPTAFLTESPVEIMKSGKYNQVPLIIGCVSNEGLLVRATILGFSFEFSKDHIVPWYFNLQPGSAEFEKVKTEVSDFYFKNGVTDEAQHDLYSDTLFVNGVVECTKLQKQNAKYPIYLYNFDAVTPLGNAFYQFLTRGEMAKQFKGACHALDLVYLFRKNILELNHDDIKVVRNIIQLWTSFAKSGTPQSDSVKWEPVTDIKNLKALRIDTELSMIDNPLYERTEFWGQYFEKYQLKFD